MVSTIYGRPRTTLDIDVIIDDTNEKINNLQNILRKNGFDLYQNEILKTIHEHSHCSIFHKNFPFRIDLQGVYSPLDERAIQNREKRLFLNYEAFVEKAEDLVIAKLVYGSHQDLEDAKVVIFRQKEKLDMDYLQVHTEKEQVEEKLTQILKDLEQGY